jgi:hypothetical protein
MVAESTRTTSEQRNDQAEAATMIRPVGDCATRTATALLTVAILGLWGCAEVGAPPGGEKDITGPRLLVSYPSDGAIGVVPDSYIRLQFSETLVKPDQGSAVFISPRPSRPPEVKWKSDELLVTLPELFRTNQTYVVSVSSNVTDLRRNRIDSAITIAFSTGQTLDSGLVSGRVLTPESKPALGWLVGLYPAGALDNYQLSDSLYPQYLTTVSGDGQFRLRYLPSVPFSLLAFEDKNRDELFNPAAEPFAIPDREIVVGGSLRLDRLQLAGTTYDSAAPEILSAVPTRDHLIRVRFNRKISPNYLASHLDLTTLFPISDTAADTVRCGGVFEADLDLTDVVTLFFPGIGDGLFRMALQYRADVPPIVRDSLLVKLQVDDAPPTISSFRPGENNLFADQIKLGLTFSEPVRKDSLTDQSVVLWEGDKRISCRPVWEDVFRASLETDRLRAGKKYRLDITEFEFRDLNGNALGDSLRSYSFGTLDEDSVGSITGGVFINVPGREKQVAVLTLMEPATKRVFTIHVLAGAEAHATSGVRAFEIKAPPGKYLLSGFLDQDGDGRPTPGAIRPLRLSETQATLPDTIVVRARFETAGIQLVFD